MRKTLLAIAAAALAASTSANAMTIWFSTSNVPGSEGAPANPTVNLAPGQATTLYVWASPTTADVKINGLALSCDADVAGKISAGGHTVLNPVNTINDPDTRWDAVGNGNLTASGWANDNAVATSMLGIRNSSSATYSADPGHDLVQQAYLISSFSFTGTSNGTTHLLMKVGSNTISNTASANVPVFFGAGDTTAGSGNLAGQKSTTGGVATPDATIVVGTVPEPTSLAVLGLGALGLVRRRRA